MLLWNSVPEVDPFDSLSTWRFFKFPPLLTSMLGRSWRQWHPSCAQKAIHIHPVLVCAAAPDVCCKQWLPSSSSSSTADSGLSPGLTGSEQDHDYFGWVKTFPSLKQIWSWILSKLKINEFNYDSYKNSFLGIQPQFHDIAKHWIHR